MTDLRETFFHGVFVAAIAPYQEAAALIGGVAMAFYWASKAYLLWHGRDKE